MSKNNPYKKDHEVFAEREANRIVREALDSSRERMLHVFDGSDNDPRASEYPGYITDDIGGGDMGKRVLLFTFVICPIFVILIVRILAMML